MRLIKYVLPSLLAASLTLGALTFAGGVEAPITINTKPVDVLEVVPMKQDGKYTQFSKDEWKANTIVNEYESEDGKGYQVIEWEARADGSYIRSYGEGPEAVQRSYDWVKVDGVATSTK